ncbi:RNA polymerase sigma factor [Cohnella faecalis]|uniref:RNA polymerase sigma factor n=1 Tax=Cohnella faecalis TaxID=2315694 RepID=A0A398CQL2_9BACL|nr:RNA polymerase sigma factor [Cohnella faecalis]RIE04823.1 RNA polymerase sigma factor [Cohnella faecalis]
MSAALTYEELVVPHLEDLRKYCYFLTNSKWDGEDLCQEALLKSLIYFLHSEPRLDVKPFLIRVARNLWIDDCRAKKRRQRAGLHHFASCYTDTNYAEVRGTMEWLSERLPSRNIEMWLLSEYFGYTMQEISDELDSSVPAVKSVLFRTRGLIRMHKELSQRKETKDRKPPRQAVNWEVERWSRAVIADRPHMILN